VNAIRAEDAELALVIAAKVNEAATTFARTGQRYLVNRSNALAVFILKQHNRLARHRRGQTKIGEFNQLAGDRLLRRGYWGMRLRVHLTIEAEAMYPLK
jgi:hypothetical protein